MNREGPALEYLTHRLSECPTDFLEEPHFRGRGSLFVDAVVSDLICALGGEMISAEEANIISGDDPLKRKVNRLRLAAIVCWLLCDLWFLEQRTFAADAKKLIMHRLEDRARIVRAEKFIDDPERREELVRFVLKMLGLRPAGESKSQAEDRLDTIDCVERQRVLRKTKEAQKRLKKIQQAMARKAAEAAAAKVSRE